MEETRKRRSFLGTLLKVILSIILVIAVMVVGAYLVLKFALGIDVIDIKRKINLLNAPVSESEVILTPYTDEDTDNAFFALFGNHDVYSFNGESYEFNKEAFKNSSVVSGEIKLSAEEFASCTNQFIKNYLASSANSADINVGIELKQIAFSNFDLQDNLVKTNVIAVLKIDLSSVREEIRGYNNFVSNLVLKYIPENIYITTNADVTINNGESNIAVNKIKINNLTDEQSQSILDLLTRITGGQNSNFVNDIANQFIGIIFSKNGEEGLLSTLNINNFTFEKDEAGKIYIVLQSQTEMPPEVTNLNF